MTFRKGDKVSWGPEEYKRYGEVTDTRPHELVLVRFKNSFGAYQEVWTPASILYFEGASKPKIRMYDCGGYYSSKIDDVLPKIAKGETLQYAPVKLWLSRPD